MRLKLLLFLLLASFSSSFAQHSVARQWNEVLLEAIRNDFARPTVHARNLFHVSMAMYDAWAAYDPVAEPYLLGKTVNGFTYEYNGITIPANRKAAQEEAISYAAYRLLQHRFKNSPGIAVTFALMDQLMESLGYDTAVTSTNYSTGSPAALGNYIAASVIEFGLYDGSNEQGSYANLFYLPTNEPLVMKFPGNPDLVEPNRWQPLTLDVFIDQSGHVIPFNTPPFLSPEWGGVAPFALKEEDMRVYQRNGFNFRVFHDPGMPPQLDLTGANNSDEFKWTFALVAVWSGHLDPSDGVLWDISPAAKGNLSVEDYPTTLQEFKRFYDFENGDPGRGYAVNPVTGQPYQPQIVPRGDYTRALAEFWADGPKSETPPGHWFTILNYVNDHPLLEKRFKGQGDILDDLEWDIKAYFILGGAMHDAAITAWGVKGWYDFVRPVSAIRYMAGLGQSTDPNLPSYHPAGIILVPNHIEIVGPGDDLQGINGEHIGKIKLRAWKGPTYINDPATEEAGVDWILAENWWPYQRPSFVTPPFAGYVSGHSTYSRTAAEVLTLLTGSKFFPGGMSEFQVRKNEYLVFEEGPSVDFTLQWATYQDASDQCSLSRIWGGIHPPADDIAGRFMGMKIGPDAFHYAEQYFNGSPTSTENPVATAAPGLVYPNPVQDLLTVEYKNPERLIAKLYSADGRVMLDRVILDFKNSTTAQVNVAAVPKGVFFLIGCSDNGQPVLVERVVRL